MEVKKNMAKIEIKGLNTEDVVKLNRLAAEKGISREEYMRRLIRKHLLESDIKIIENRYENLVKTVAEVIKDNSEKMEELIEVLKVGVNEDDEEEFYDF